MTNPHWMIRQFQRHLSEVRRMYYVSRTWDTASYRRYRDQTLQGLTNWRKPMEDERSEDAQENT
jgi:hypothetical protein